MACNGLKKGPFHLFRHPTRSRINFGKTHFKSFLTIFSSQNNPLSMHFVSLEGPKWLAMGSKRAHFTCLGTLDGLGLFLENTFLTIFFFAKQPIFKKVWDCRRAKTPHYELETCQKHLFRHSMWSTIILERSHCFAPGGPC